MLRNVFNRGMILQAIVSVGLISATSNGAIAQDSATTTPQTIESRTQGQDIALDANDFPVLAYQHVSTFGIRSLKVARCTDVNCTGVRVATLASLGAGLPVDTDAIISTGSITVMIDSNDRPVVGYTHNDQLRVARCLDRECNRVSLRSIGTGQLAAFALDNNDLIAAVYTTDAVAGDSTSRAIDLARCTNKQCSSVTTNRVETMDQPDPQATNPNFTFPQRPALAIDSRNNPVVSYVDGGYRYEGGNSAIVARCIDSVCNAFNKTTIIDDAPLAAPSMVLDSVDNPIVIVEELRGIFGDVTNYIACLDVDCNDRQERIRRTSWESNFAGKSRSLAVAADGSVTFIVVGEADGNALPELYYCATTLCDNFEFRGLIAGDTAEADIPILAVDQAGEPVVAFGVSQYYSRSLFSTFSGDLRSLRVTRCGSEPCANIQDVQNGTYYLQSVFNNRYLSVGADMSIETSSEPGRSEIWYIDTESGLFNNASIRNVESNSYLALYPPFPRRVGALARLTTSTTKFWDQIWLDGRGYGILKMDLPKARHLVEIDKAGSGVIGRPLLQVLKNPLDTEVLWRIVPTQSTSNELVGTKIALQNSVTGRWLDNDPNGNVDQSVNQSTDDIWLVEDAGEGYVYLVNEFTGLYLNAEKGKINLDSSSTRTLDNRWELRFAGDELTLRSIDFDGYVSAQGFRGGFNAIRKSGLSASSYWTPRIIQ